MSFQGDVAGIGLGELLQGLSRGGRDGVLWLYAEDRSAALGLCRGQLYCLPGPDEEEDHWRVRAANAFADDEQGGMENARRTRIARSARLENIYQMLEAPNLHFRFEPGPLPMPAGVSPDDPEAQPWGPGLTVEYMLLEHARISDESKAGIAATLSPFDIPRAVDISSVDKPEVRDFLTQCDGRSTIQELADRLGWTLSQCRATLGEHLTGRLARLAGPREMLTTAQRELEIGRLSRAAHRLHGWVVCSPAGAPAPEDAELLLSEWENGNLRKALSSLPPRVTRALLRKLDRASLADRKASHERWRAYYDQNRGDQIAALHEVALRLVKTGETKPRTYNDLLHLARNFQEKGYRARTRTLLRLAASHLPEKQQTRIELGRRMLETGLVEEGTRWLLDTAHQIIEAGDPEKALGPIRAVLREIPDHAEAGSLQIHARTLLRNMKRHRVHMAIGLSLALVLSVSGLVWFRNYRKNEEWLTKIQSYVGQPDQGLAMIEEAYGSDPPEAIRELQTRFLTLKHAQDAREFEEWRATYVNAEDACRFGDPMLGLNRALELPRSPRDEGNGPGTTERQELLGQLAKRLEDRAVELDLPPGASPEELNQELRFLDLLEQLLVAIDPQYQQPEVQTFRFHLEELSEKVSNRREERAVAWATLSAKELADQQDILLATARAHATAGDLVRSLAAYDRLLASDESLIELPQLQQEVQAVRRHLEAVERANTLAAEGRHPEAAELLRGVCPRPLEHPLSFTVNSSPSGVQVVSSSGQVRVTPFVTRTGIGEVIELTFTRAGFSTRTVRLDSPRNIEVQLFKRPEREWKSANRVEAAPVPTGDDHVMADRNGRIRRLDAESKTKWELSLPTLGGIARTPIFLPERPGHLLVISEDGKAWLVNATTGEFSGPRDIGAIPGRGPVLTRSGVTVSFSDGRVGVWTGSLEPVFYTDESLIPTREEDNGRTSNLTLLRRTIEGPRSLESPWNQWTASVLEDEVRAVGPDGLGFSAVRHGDWEFIAWESPRVFVPTGRLWVSDEGGIRSYVPTPSDLVSFGSE